MSEKIDIEFTCNPVDIEFTCNPEGTEKGVLIRRVQWYHVPRKGDLVLVVDNYEFEVIDVVWKARGEVWIVLQPQPYEMLVDIVASKNEGEVWWIET